jgi:hypothetical protein
MEKEIHEKDEEEEEEEEEEDSEEAPESSSRLDKEGGESSEEERSVSEKEDKEEERMSSDKAADSMSVKPPDSMSANHKHHIKVDHDKDEESEESEGKEEHKEEKKEESKEPGEASRGANLQGLEKGQAKDMQHAERGAREESGGASPRKEAETREGSEASEEPSKHLGAKITPVIKQVQLERLCN